MMQQALASYLVNAAWQAPVVTACALIITRFGGLSAPARNRVWLGFLAMAVILPAVALDAILPRALPTVARVPAAGAAVFPNALPDPAAAPPCAPRSEPAMRLAPWSAWTMIALFALVAAALVARLVVASLAARRLVAESRPADLPAEVAEALDKLARAHGRAVPPVRRSAQCAQPRRGRRPAPGHPDPRRPGGSAARTCARPCCTSSPTSCAMTMR